MHQILAFCRRLGDMNLFALETLQMIGKPGIGSPALRHLFETLLAGLFVGPYRFSFRCIGRKPEILVLIKRGLQPLFSRLRLSFSRRRPCFDDHHWGLQKAGGRAAGTVEKTTGRTAAGWCVRWGS